MRRNGREDVENCAGVLHDLRERVKELSALHATARVLQDDRRPVPALLQEIVDLVPSAWQYPDLACARIVFGAEEFRTTRFALSEARQRTAFRTAQGTPGIIEVYYRDPAPAAVEGPFLAEERSLIDSLAEMLRSFLERREATRLLEAAHAELERRVADRTAELVDLNRTLAQEIVERRRSEERIGVYRERLRSLVAELAATEEIERRAIAEQLHDDIGQALATVKIQLAEVQGSAAFCGYEETLASMRSLLDRAIRATRSLTVEISPPVLYDLGLFAALHWLGDQFGATHGLQVEVGCPSADPGIDEPVQLTVFKAVREFLVNSVKHGRATYAEVAVAVDGGRVAVDYRDDGVGFDLSILDGHAPRAEAFGLFNVRERCEYLGGSVGIESAPGHGVRIALELPLTLSVTKERSHAGARRHRG
ncbi:MAG: sensor histidine kinase [Acidobacteria bacterium]|nr:sensor histidine kinase [Acidobacteriota bacterium]